MSTEETIEVDGPRAAAEILCRLPRDTRTRLVRSIRTLNPASALKIESIIVQSLSTATPSAAARRAPTREVSAETNPPASSQSISSITQVPDEKLQEVLRQVAPRELAVSLTRASREAQEKVLSNISSTKQRAVLDELQELPSMKSSDVEAAQARLLKDVEDVYSEDPPPTPPSVRRLRSRLA